MRTNAHMALLVAGLLAASKRTEPLDAPRPKRERQWSGAPIPAGMKEVHDKHGSRLVRIGPRVGRNDPCPCGSGRKAKRCCR